MKDLGEFANESCVQLVSALVSNDFTANIESGHAQIANNIQCLVTDAFVFETQLVVDDAILVEVDDRESRTQNETTYSSSLTKHS